MLVRHGQSEWNLQNLFTGWRDPALTELGPQRGCARPGQRAESSVASLFDKAYHQQLCCAPRTRWALILEEIGQLGLETVCDAVRSTSATMAI